MRLISNFGVHEQKACSLTMQGVLRICLSMRFSHAFWGLFFLSLAVLFSECRFFSGKTGSGVVETKISKDIALELKAIKDAYRAPDCYSARFRITGKSPGKSSQSANGSILADNVRERLRMEFKMPFLGILISRLIVLDGQAYLNDVYHKKKFQAPVKRFALGGVNASSIPLPFSIFQDMLFARLPKRIYEGRAVRILHGKFLEVSWEEGGESFFYKFESRMLRQMRYESKRGARKQVVVTNLSGRFPGTGFPRTIQVVSDQAALNPSQKSSMLLRFYSVHTKARCPDSGFVPQ